MYNHLPIDESAEHATVAEYIGWFLEIGGELKGS